MTKTNPDWEFYDTWNNYEENLYKQGAELNLKVVAQYFFNIGRIIGEHKNEKQNRFDHHSSDPGSHAQCLRSGHTDHRPHASTRASHSDHRPHASTRPAHTHCQRHRQGYT